MVRQETTGDSGDVEVTLTIEGPDEALANRIYADIVGHLDEIKQMVDYDIPEDEASPAPYGELGLVLRGGHQ